ncbi:MAG: DEAD/DEAH box helicase [Desulfobacteraceae bacterium]|nr:MAG: DEAD/DEAH box helicase [Desulfobacteraceae bacterium]
MKITIANRLTLESVPKDVSKAIRERLTFQNPKWIENDRLGHWNGSTPRTLEGFTRTDSGLVVPRGFIRQLTGICRREGVTYELIDYRRSLPVVTFTLKGTLRPYQIAALQDILSSDFGVVQMPTGAGKTILALAVIAARKQPALIVVHTRELLEQWIERIVTFLGIPREEIGVIGNGKRTVGDRITVALVQSLYKCAAEVAPRIGFLIVDECHRAPSRTFTEAVTVFDCRFMLGLSATAYRRDGLGRLIWWCIGDRVHEIPKEALQDTGDILRADVVQRETAFRTSFDPSDQYSQMLSELTEDRARNSLIAADVVKEARNGGGICLVLSDRKGHCQDLADLIQGRGVPVEILTGDTANGRRQEIVERLNAGAVKVLVATGQLIGEGFDCKALSTLFLATPIKFSGRLIQYLGRVLRPAPGKDKARVFDYIDTRIGVLRAAAKARSRVYGN